MAEQSKLESTWFNIRLLCISLLLILISCISASMLQTDFGKVTIIPFKIPTDNGQWVAGNLFKPIAASSEKKVPIVITSHGYLNNKEMQDITAIELSRRGIAVIAMDAYYHGDSSSSKYSYSASSPREGMGMIPLVEYVYTNLNYIDKTKIGITGHSMGGGITWDVARYYGRLYEKAIHEAQKPDSENGVEITPKEMAAAKAKNKIAAAFPVSQIRASTPKSVAEIHSNFGANFAFYDEGAYRNTNGNGDLRTAPESKHIINSIFSKNNQLSSIEIGKMYGSAHDGTLRVIYNPKEIHPWQHFSQESSTYMTTFFTTAFQMDSPIPASNQIWFWKELMNFIGLIGLFLFIVPFSVLLLKIPFFASLKHPVPPLLPALSTGKSKAFFWGSWLVTALVSFVSFMPITRLDLYIWPNVANRLVAKWFPQTTTNFVMLWAIFNGLFVLILFWLTYRYWGKKNGVNPETWGIKITVREFLMNLVLATTILCGIYGLVCFAQFLFYTDFRLWSMAVKGFSADKVGYLLMYLPFFFIFYLASAISTNSGSRFEGQKEWKNLLICGFGNILGLILLEAVQYGCLFATGIPYWSLDWLRPVAVFPLLPLLFAVVYISRYLFKATGNVYLGAMVNCILMVLMAVANTATFTPM